MQTLTARIDRHPARFLLAYGGPVASLVGGWWGAFSLLGATVWFILAASALDAWLGDDFARDEFESHVPRRKVWRALLWLWAPVEIGLVVVAAVYLRGQGSDELWRAVLAGWCVGFAIGVIGIPIAHELLHSARPWERGLADAIMLSCSYPHFRGEHVFGHHRLVATPRDSATAQIGEPVYSFFLRRVVRSWRDAWTLESRRLRRRGRNAWSWRNRVLRQAGLLGIAYLAVGMLAGRAGLAFFAALSVTAVFLLEAVNYIQHYGLTRRETSAGQFEPVGARHSWNSNHLLSNWAMFNLGRHADHHLRSGIPFYCLRSRAEAPALPAGYGAMFALAMFPPLWRAVMDPRVRRWRLDQALCSLDCSLPGDVAAMSETPFQRTPQDWLYVDVAELCEARASGALGEAEFVEILRAREQTARSDLRRPWAAFLILCGLAILLMCGGCGLAPLLMRHSH